MEKASPAFLFIVVCENIDSAIVACQDDFHKQHQVVRADIGDLASVIIPSYHPNAMNSFTENPYHSPATGVAQFPNSASRLLKGLSCLWGITCLLVFSGTVSNIFESYFLRGVNPSSNEFLLLALAALVVGILFCPQFFGVYGKSILAVAIATWQTLLCGTMLLIGAVAYPFIGLNTSPVWVIVIGCICYLLMSMLAFINYAELIRFRAELTDAISQTHDNSAFDRTRGSNSK